MDQKLLTATDATLGLSLSGGGFRATLFHLGVLRRLNDLGLLSRMTLISSVSGGSILNGLLAVRWQRLRKGAGGIFTNFEEEVEQPVREFCSKNLRNYPLLTGRLDPRNWWNLAKDDYSATNLLAEEYDSELLGGATMQMLSDILNAGGPRFVFCATNLATGVNWRFDGKRMGDYQVGYTWKPEMTLGMAVAASSAFPLAFPPLVLELEGSQWEFGDLPDGETRDEMRKKAHLTDGGVYDNMGLEPVWKKHDFVFCSDAGAPFGLEGEPGGNIASRLKRASDIIDRQSRALRRRMLIDAFDRKDYRGAFWGIATNIEEYPLEPKATGYTGGTLEAIGDIRTDLDVFTKGEQLVLMNHGWLLSGAAIRAYCAEWADAASKAPDATLLDGSAALAAVRKK
ncbi:MAG: patatin-like phospholipase family protein [Bryobacterales bacterium]|nr:patatin-like phospholipase family protein [Bryobacterales bacterium]